MPEGANHAASAVVGNKFYVIGGRGGGNVVADGRNTVQVLNLQTNKWISTKTSPKSVLEPLPVARGGTGVAVVVDGLIYVIGGETKNPDQFSTSLRVYHRVDIYNPSTNKWTVGPSLQVPRHGIFPVYCNGGIHVFGGGIRAGFSSSKAHELLQLN